MVPLTCAAPPHDFFVLMIVGPWKLPDSVSPDCCRKPEAESWTTGLGYCCVIFTCQLPLSGPLADELELDPPPQSVSVNVSDSTSRAYEAVTRFLTDLPRKQKYTTAF